MLPARRFGFFSMTFLKSIKASSLLYMLQDWVRREIVADDPWDGESYTEVPTSTLPPASELSSEMLPLEGDR
jgi:hypothetical protein